MKKVFSKLPLPGRKSTAAERLSNNNNWHERPDFSTALSDSEDDEAAALTSANLRVHKDRPVTNEGERLKRGIDNARDWINQSPLPQGRHGSLVEDDSSAYEDGPYCPDPASSRLGVDSDKCGDRIQPYRAQGQVESSDGEGTPLGQKMFNELTRMRSTDLPTADGKRKKSVKRRGESAGRKVTYNLTDDSESMDDLDMLPQRTGLLHGIHSGPSYHDPLEREISCTLDAYGSRSRISKSRGSSRGGTDFKGQDSERTILTMDSPQACARALAEADNLMNMYSQPRGVDTLEVMSHRIPQSIKRPPSSSRAAGRPKSVLRIPSVPHGPQKMQYANGLGGTSGVQSAMEGGVAQYNISDSSESEGNPSYSRGQGNYARRVRSRNGYEDESSWPMTRTKTEEDVSSARIGTGHSKTRSRDLGSGSVHSGRAGATDTLARTLQTVNRTTRNPDYLPDLDDSDSDVLRQTDSDADGDQQDTMRRLELSHAKTAPFSLNGTNDFDSFMKSVDKSVNRAVKVERRSQKSRAGSRPGSRTVSRGESRGDDGERLPSTSGSRAAMRQQKEAGPQVVSSSTSDMPIQPRQSASGPSGYVAPLRPESRMQTSGQSVVKDLGASVGLRRQHLAQIENGRVIPNPTPEAKQIGSNFSPANTLSPSTAMSPGTLIRRPVTSHQEIMLAEQQEEMELLQRQQQDALRKEREQQDILNRLKRDKTRREAKVKGTQEQLESLWEEQMMKDDVQYQQQKEIERLRHTLVLRDQRERAQQDELERLRRDVSERARADAEGAMAFDKLLAEKHKKLLLTPAQIRQQVDQQMQREALQRENEAELHQLQQDQARVQAEELLKARQEQIARDASRHATPGISKSDLLRHRNSSHDGNGNVASSRSQPRNVGSPSQVSRPATQQSIRNNGSRPGTACTTLTVDSTCTSIREVKEASDAVQFQKGGAQTAKFKAQHIPGYTNALSTKDINRKNIEHGIEENPTHKVKASASKETPGITKERDQAVKKLNLELIKNKHDKAPALKKYEMEQQIRDHAKELQRASDDARHQAEFVEAKRILGGPTRRQGHDASSAYSSARTSSTDTPLDELKRLEEEKAEFERREQLHEEYIQQLTFEQEQKLEREAAKRRALQDLRGENNLIDRMLRETDSLETGLIKEVGTLEALKEQFRRKQKLAEQLKAQSNELAEKQKEREQQLKSLKSEVSKASDAAGIQLMQMNRLKAIQEEAIYMQEKQHKELENLKAELQRKADLTGEQEEIARLREQAKRLEADQADQRALLRKEKESLEKSMKTQEDVEKEMQRIQKEKVKREEAERYLRQTLAMETREMEKLSAEAAERKAEIEALQAEKEAKQKEIEGTEKGILQQELEELRKRKDELADNERRILSEKAELEELNRRREEELRELEALRKRSEEIERAQAKAKRAEEEALRAKEEKERARLRAEEDRIRAALEYEARKAQQEMEKERKKRQNEIDRLKKEIENKKISEQPLIEEDEEEEAPVDKKVSDWLQSNHPDDVEESKSRAKKEKKKKKSSAGDITARSTNDDDDDGGGDQTDRSDTSGKGPPTQWRLARHGKVKELEAILTADNVDHRDGKGNTCLHHACMQGKKRIAKMVLRLGADINAQNRRGHTCLHYCFAYNYNELGEYLITKGADEAILNELGATCREVESGSVTQRSEG